MKKIFFILFGLIHLNAMSQNLFIDTFLEKWGNSKIYLIQLAEAMPESQYAYKPTEKQKTFAEQLIHIKGNIDWLSKTYFGDGSLQKEQTNTTPTKKQLIDALKTSFDVSASLIANLETEKLAEKVDFFAGRKTKMQIMNLLQDHVTHHRGQLIVYLKLNQIEPPQYSGW
ncbi:DinB family protein [uncultured Kriegella sp.]|uniref:DinB family protein n=1 Tax=uncultured Kriegella sp. TaxID=1798910 RepID=UPI0030DB662E|tara:strand:- start:6419 stop:6928 length:510 start_codon:yes stop_codon:yes gene_type:complete